MIEIIEDSQIGNYYLEILPFVQEMGLSFDSNIDKYSLECDSTYNSNNRIGSFTGYPGKFNSEGRLIIGFANASGLIYISKTEFYEVSNGTIERGNFDKFNQEYEYSEEKKSHASYIPSAQCTSIECCINKYSELLIHSNPYSNKPDNFKSMGIFSGMPGEYYYDEISKSKNRRYGNEYSVGTIILNGPYDFKYQYDYGNVVQYKLNNKNIYKLYSFNEMCL